ncbi:MAG TPA: HmuY family protein, partial [Polyangiaceae bacterium]|nr:HmuY family protein [Polyangiaceae bacterium]
VDKNGTGGTAGNGAAGTAGTIGAGAAGSGSTDDTGLELTVGPDSRTFVELGTPSVLSDIAGTGSESIAWDIALQGHDVFTNGGISGPGNSSAFGPLSSPTYLSDTAPDVPLMLKDRAGGALIDWYKYAGATHQLFSRYHVYGVRDGERYYKLQVLTYYGEQLGTAVAALYRVRYAELTAAGVGTTHDVKDIDATAGGSKDNDKQPSACLDLDSEQVTPLTPADAGQSSDWQLCFRRESISVNGGLSGPRGVEAVDLQAADTANETPMDVQARTAATEQKLFDDVDYAALSDPALAYAPDGVVTAFAQRWLEPGSDPLALSDSVWLVLGADGASKYLMQFSDLSGDPATGPATLSLQAKSVK